MTLVMPSTREPSSRNPFDNRPQDSHEIFIGPGADAKLLETLAPEFNRIDNVLSETASAVDKRYTGFLKRHRDKQSPKVRIEEPESDEETRNHRQMTALFKLTKKGTFRDR